MTVGELVKTKRCELMLTQKQLAELLNYKNSVTIRNIESGDRPIPKRMREAFSEVLGLTEEEMTIGNDEPFVKPHRAKMRGSGYQSSYDWRNKYLSETYDYFKIRFRKGERQKFMDISKDKGYDSFHQFCLDAIKEKAEK